MAIVSIGQCSGRLDIGLQHEVGNDFPRARARFLIVQTCGSTNGTVVVEVEVL
jgi:hypothetical protein